MGPLGHAGRINVFSCHQYSPFDGGSVSQKAIENHPIDWKLAITWIVIVAVGCWLWAEFIEFLESRRMRHRFARPRI